MNNMKLVIEFTEICMSSGNNSDMFLFPSRDRCSQPSVRSVNTRKAWRRWWSRRRSSLQRWPASKIPTSTSRRTSSLWWGRWWNTHRRYGALSHLWAPSCMSGHNVTWVCFQLSQMIVSCGGIGVVINYLGNCRGSLRLPGIMMLGYVAAHSENLAMAVILSKVGLSLVDPPGKATWRLNPPRQDLQNTLEVILTEPISCCVSSCPVGSVPAGPVSVRGARASHQGRHRLVHRTDRSPHPWAR